MPENDALVQVIKMHPEILQQMLSTVLNIIMFEDCRNQWSMSRPLLGLILLNEDYFQSLRDQVNNNIFKSVYMNFLTIFLIDNSVPTSYQTGQYGYMVQKSHGGS
jgi:hypothetical protein